MSSTRGPSGIAFPQNPNRPTQHGRGERESRPTPGMQNHLDTRQRNREIADKASATHQKNGTTTGPKATNTAPPTTPLTPTTAQNRLPPTRLTAQATPLTQFIPRLPSFQATTPQSSPIVQFPPRPRSPPSLVPDNYQPTYPNYGPLPVSNVHSLANNSTTAVSVAPNLRDPRLEQMMERLSPQDLSHMNEMLGTSLQPINPRSGASFDFGTFHDQHGTWGGDQYTGGDMNGNINLEGDGFGLQGRDPGSPTGDNDPADEGPTADEELDHRNAQSSLEVSMHDVDVQRKRKRKRSAPERTRRKKCANCRNQSRSIQGFTGDHRRALEAAYPIIQKAVCFRIPWPVASPSGDPAADDDFEALIDDSYDEAVEVLDLDPEDFNSRKLTTPERNLIRARISQVQGCIMVEVDKLVPASYGFVDVASLPEPTPEKIQAAEEGNHQLVADLQGTFMYKASSIHRCWPLLHDTSDIATIGRHKIFQKLLNATFFAKKGINRCLYYFKDDDLMPCETLGLFHDAIVCGIDRWKTGHYEVVPFVAETYGRLHEDSMVFVNAWVTEYASSVHPVNLAEACGVFQMPSHPLYTPNHRDSTTVGCTRTRQQSPGMGALMPSATQFVEPFLSMCQLKIKPLSKAVPYHQSLHPISTAVRPSCMTPDHEGDGAAYVVFQNSTQPTGGADSAMDVQSHSTTPVHTAFYITAREWYFLGDGASDVNETGANMESQCAESRGNMSREGAALVLLPRLTGANTSLLPNHSASGARWRPASVWTSTVSSVLAPTSVTAGASAQRGGEAARNAYGNVEQ
ncbi:hypothetical protein B0H10DRAFT_1952754 [Mycena sp. CBHHK59/15]|nr:hypothetical protein B0H10DRAFT_1952754 [Mycena sp. CBHHK59/15]